MKSAKAKSIKSKYYWLLALCSVAYIALTLTAPLTTNTFNISETNIRLLQLSFILPILIIWFLAVYGVANFKYYSQLIRDSADGKALNTVSNGLLVLVSGSIAQSIFGTFRVRMLNAGHIIGFTHLNLVLVVAFPLAAFYIVYIGGAELLRLARQESLTPQSYLLPIVSFTVLSSLYTWAILANQYRNFTPDITKFSSYFLSDPLIILLVVAPIVTTWLLGILGATSIRNYHQSAKGALYRQALSKLAYGLFSVVIFAILVQFLGALGPQLNLSQASLKFILILVYVILALYAVGYGFIASGAKRLTKIEEVQ